MSDPACTMRIKLYRKPGPLVIVKIFDDHFAPNWDSAGRVRLTYEVRHGGKVIFPKGQLYGAIHGSSNGVRAKEHALAHIAMHPGDGSGVDDDFYEGYTKDQLDWVTAHGEALDMERMDRYCDEDGNPRKDRS